jgi:hypothetical protein
MGSYIFLESTAQRPLDWTDSYWKFHDKPYGAEVFHEIFTLHQENIQEVNNTPFEFISENQPRGNYLFFNSSLSIGDYDVKKIFDWVDEGNTLFMSAEYLPELVLDTLGLDKEAFMLKDEFSYKPVLKLDSLSDGFQFNKNENFEYFKFKDTVDVEVLGYVQAFKKDSTVSKNQPNFIKTPFGSGEIYLHLFPKAFTNYFLIDSTNFNYTKNILKYLDYENKIYIDQNFKVQKDIKPKHVLQYLVNNEYLRWAYYLILLTGIIYIFFEGKRKQKPIKVVKPFENKTYAFTKTISDMYFRKKDHKSIATKLIEHFFDFVRDQYLIPTSVIDDNFVKQLASKSGQDIKKIKALLKQIENIEQQESISKESLIRLEKQIATLKS